MRPSIFRLGVRRRGIGIIIESRFMSNARRAIRWIILRIKYKVRFFNNKCLIFYTKRRKLICTPDIISSIIVSFRISLICTEKTGYTVKKFLKFNYFLFTAIKISFSFLENSIP